jgi:hypothetical protein
MEIFLDISYFLPLMKVQIKHIPANVLQDLIIRRELNRDYVLGGNKAFNTYKRKNKFNSEE